MGELFLPLEGLMDVEAEKARLTKKLEEYRAEIAKVEQKLANPSFTQKVPAAGFAGTSAAPRPTGRRSWNTPKQRWTRLVVDREMTEFAGTRGVFAWSFLAMRPDFPDNSVR